MSPNPINLQGLGPWMSTKPYKFIWFGAMDVTNPYQFIWFGAMDVDQTLSIYKVWGHGCHQTL